MASARAACEQALAKEPAPRNCGQGCHECSRPARIQRGVCVRVGGCELQEPGSGPEQALGDPAVASEGVRC